MKLRFAPSPTGALHIGGARTALYNWLVARGQGGALALRIEDTDPERSTPENVEQILDALRWLEIDWDEGPVFQSQRADRHREVLERLLADGTAYRSTATTEDVSSVLRYRLISMTRIRFCLLVPSGRVRLRRLCFTRNTLQPEGFSSRPSIGDLLLKPTLPR